MASKKSLLSVVIPAYKEEKNIPLIYKELHPVLKTLTDYDYEIIFVNDGSPDTTWLEIQKLCAQHKKVKGINLSRNFGKEIALTAGVYNAKGEAVITTDADGQRPAFLIKDLVKKWEENNEIVYGVRTKMHRGFFRKLSSNLFNFIMQKISDMNFDTAITDFMIIDRSVINYFLKYEDKNRIFRGIILSIGFRQDKIYFEEPPRAHGSSGWGFRQLYKLAIDSITSFSLFPLRLIGYIGIFIVFTSSFLLVFMTTTRFFLGNPFYISNTAFFIVSNILLSGVTLSGLGVLALYIANIHTEVTKKPLYMEREKVNF